MSDKHETAPRAERPVGLTKDVGWELGASRTFDTDAKTLWRFLTSAKGSRLFVGASHGLIPGGGSAGERNDAGSSIGGNVDDRGTTNVGLSPPSEPWDISYKITTYSEGSHVRMQWTVPGWARPTTLQIRVVPKPNGRAALSIMQDHLAGAAMRETMIAYWKDILDLVAAALK